MVKLANSNELGVKLMAALGLEGRPIKEIVLKVRVDEPPTLRFTELLASQTTAQTEEIITQKQGDTIAREITDFHSEPFREFTRLDTREEMGFLVAAGPAERLARAVLAGDVKTALVLADYIQEEWARCHS